jgi:alkanesulfonate monooxygenase SsuD/methylene tetrahydromethanopterin reductase-like flavin-dependent oxidoreductase (luciferase family)
MKLSLSITDFTLPGGPDGLAEHLGHVVAAADEAGLDTVWVPDHLL